MSPDQIVNTVSGLLHDLVLAGGGKDPQFSPDTCTESTVLKDLGVDSLLLTQFITELEDRFAIEFELDDLTPANFATIGSTSVLVRRYHRASVGTDGDHVPLAVTPASTAASQGPEPQQQVSGNGGWWPESIEAQLLFATARLSMTREHVQRALAALGSVTPRLDWGAFFDMAARHRVLGLVARSFDREHLGPLGTVRRSTLRASYLYNQGRAQAWQRERRDLLAAFAAEGLSPVVRKGSYLAQYVYPDPAMRYMEDTDLYVTAEETERLAATMIRLGYRQGGDSRDRRTVEPLDRDTELFWRLNVTALPPFLRPTSDPYVDMFSVDLRRDLMEPASGKSIPAEDFRARARKVRLAGESAWVPSDEDMIIDLGVHLFREATTLSSIRSGKDLCLIRFVDLAQWYVNVRDTLDHDALISRAEHYDVAAELYFALHFGDLLEPGLYDPELLRRLRPADLRYLDVYGTLDRQEAEWPHGFLERLFDRHRGEHVSGHSALPRPRQHWTDDHSGDKEHR